MLEAGIIYPIDMSKWTSPMVVQHKKYDPKKLIIWVNFKNLNRAIVVDPFPTPYVDKIISEVARHECYYFIDAFYSYNQVPIAKKY